MLSVNSKIGSTCCCPTIGWPNPSRRGSCATSSPPGPARADVPPMTYTTAPDAAMLNPARGENESSLGGLVEQLERRSDLRITTWESGEPRERTHAQLYEDVRSAQAT